MVLGPATTAERAWDDVATIDLDRGSNTHIVLGVGPQRCLGSHLARMELRVTIEDRHAAVPERSLELQHRRRPRRIENFELVQ